MIGFSYPRSRSILSLSFCAWTVCEVLLPIDYCGNLWSFFLLHSRFVLKVIFFCFSFSFYFCGFRVAVGGVCFSNLIFFSGGASLPVLVGAFLASSLWSFLSLCCFWYFRLSGRLRVWWVICLSAYFLKFFDCCGSVLSLILL